MARVKIPDYQVWTDYTHGADIQSVSKKSIQKELPPYLNVHIVPKGVGRTRLDLHGLTVQEAYDTLKAFVDKHSAGGTKAVEVITGRGVNGQGLIKKEMCIWLDTPGFKRHIVSFESLNGGGAFKIFLKNPK